MSGTIASFSIVLTGRRAVTCTFFPARCWAWKNIKVKFMYHMKKFVFCFFFFILDETNQKRCIAPQLHFKLPHFSKSVLLFLWISYGSLFRKQCKKRQTIKYHKKSFINMKRLRTQTLKILGMAVVQVGCHNLLTRLRSTTNFTNIN